MSRAQSISPNRPEQGPRDQDLIDAFVIGAIRGEEVLAANFSLRAESLFDTLQLLSLQDGVMAKVDMARVPITFLVNPDCDLWPLLHERLLSYSYFPITKQIRTQWYLYRHCELPPGYEPQCGIAKDLWRVCWGRGVGLRSGIPIDLVVWHYDERTGRDGWQALRSMDCDQGMLQIKLLGGSRLVAGGDLVVWARRTIQQSRNRQPLPPTRGYRTFN
jgi:hypothetical protein